MRLFLFEHMTVIEGMMERLHSCVERAYQRKEMFVHLMVEGSLDMQQVGSCNYDITLQVMSTLCFIL
jgi:hypothetical protein